MTIKYNRTEEEAEEIDYKNERSHSIYLRFLLHYISLTNYYTVQDTFRWQVITAQ